MAEPGSSAVYYGGSIAYNTKKSKKLLLNDDSLHQSLLQQTESSSLMDESPEDAYIRSKVKWTAETAVAFCEQMDVDYAIAEGGASGPSFRPEGMEKGFAVISIAGKNKEDGDSKAKILAHTIIRSTHADREKNMRLFADAAADLASETIGIIETRSDINTSNTPSIVELSDEHEIQLDRATQIRSKPDKIKELEEDENARYVMLCPATNQILFSSTTELALLSNQDAPSNIPKTFLGLDQDNFPIFSIDIDTSSYSPPTNTFFRSTRTNAPLLLKSHNELALYATALSTWKKTHPYCSKCGSKQEAVHGGTALQCSNSECNILSWPRQDPSIIVLITSRDQSKVLLARSPRHPPKMHTALAGFVEAGETFEQAVLREAYEETGVHVDLESVQYLASQPWPFPRSTMIAFRATADDTVDLNIDEEELVSATWFDRDQVKKASMLEGAMMQKAVAELALTQDPSLKVLIPPKGVVARLLIDNWLNDS